MPDINHYYIDEAGDLNGQAAQAIRRVRLNDFGYHNGKLIR